MANKRIDHNRNDSAGQIPEADLLEQQTPIDSALSEESLPAQREAPTEPVDEVDWWEQQQPVPTLDDDYPHDDSDDGFEAG